MTRLVRILPVLVVLAPAAAFAQTGPTPPQLVLERVRTPFVVAPDYKVTELNGDRQQLAGAYLGKLFDDKLFIGGAGYWLVDGGRAEELGYGGLLLGWSTPSLGGVRLGTRGLIGGGTGKLAREFTVVRDVRDPRRPGTAAGTATTVQVLAHDDFFVFEPQVTVSASPFQHMAVSLAGGYRVTGFTDALEGRLNGATGSIGLQFQW